MSIRVLVFPSVNEPGLEIIQALAKSNKVALFGGSSFALDYDPSRVLLEHHLKCPAFGEPDFRERFEALLRHHRIDLVFPTIDAVVAEFAGWDGSVARFVTSTAQSAAVALSKRLTYARLKDYVAVPQI